MYRIIAAKYGWTFQQIAGHTPIQLGVLLTSADNTVTFNDARQYQEWLTKRGSR